jgi:hypothetical protein
MTEHQRAAMRAAIIALIDASEQCPKPYSTACARAAEFLRAALAQQQQAEPVALTDPLHDDAYLRAIALGFPTGDARRWTLCRIADRIGQTPPRKPSAINYFRVQEIAAKRRLNYNDFSSALRDYIGADHE